MEIKRKLFTKKYIVGLICIIILFIVIITRFKVVNINDKNLYVFYGLNETGYLLNNVIIKTDIGTFELEKNIKIYPKRMLGFGIKYVLWHQIQIEGKDVKYDLSVFGEKINNVKFMLLNNRNIYTLFITPQYFNVLNSIDGINERPVNDIFFNQYKKSIRFLRDEYQSVYYVEITLDGEIKEIYFGE